MDEFCGSRFWNSETFWYSDDPDLTLCFEKTVLVWIPCAFLWILLPVEVYLLRSSKCLNIPWNSYNVAKLIAILISAAVPLAEIVTNVFLSDSYFSVDLYSPLVKFITLVLFFGLTYANVKFGRRSSGILFQFSALLALCGAFQCRTEIRSRWTQDLKYQIMEFTCYLIYYSVIVFVFIMNCFADSSPRITSQLYDKNACPRKQSSFLSRILFAWLEPLVWKAYKEPLKNEDLWTLDYSISSSNIVPTFEKHFNKSLEDSKKTNELPTEKAAKCKYKFNKNKSKKVSILPPLYRTYGLTFILATLMKIFADLLGLFSPMILSAIIDFIGNDEPMWIGYMYTILLLLVAVFQTTLTSQYYLFMYTIGLKIRACMISIIYKKALRLSNCARRDFTVGETVNLMSVDAYQFVDFLTYSFFLFSTPLQVILVTYFLWQILGPSVLAGFVTIIISILINSKLATAIKSLQMKQMKKKDERVRLLNQILSGIKVLKLYAWEPSFEKRVISIRNEEMEIQKKQTYLSCIITLTWSCTTYLMYLTTLAVFVLLSEKNVLNAKVAFVSLSLFNILKFPLLYINNQLSKLAKIIASIKRINRFLNSEDLNLEDVSHEKRSEPLVIENGSFSWEGSKETPFLRDINLKIKAGALVAVVGPVGSGKSSLISAFLGELYKISGIVNTTGIIAYVPQQAWIRNATVKDNITFGEPVDSSYYDEVLEACALKPDLKTFPAGDLTEIGEKGINLSGGQKQRLSLARAVYYGADVYLLDDPLSAVDSHVGKHIFEQVIGPNGLLKNKTRLLVTHSVTYLSQVDLIVVMKDGSISESGTFDELLESKGDFSEFLIHYLEENEDCAEEDFHKLVDSLEEKNLSSEQLIRQRSIRCVNGSIGSLNRQRSMNSKGKTFHEERNILKETIAGEKLIEEEHTETGNINRDVFAYFVRTGGILLGVLILLGNLISQSLSIISNMWLSKWTDNSNRTTAEGTQDIDERNYYLSIYALLGLSKGVSDCLTDLANRIACWNSAKNSHNAMLSNLFRLPLSFMDVTPSGRILSRFSKDIDVLDNTLPNLISTLYYGFGEVIGIIIIVSCGTPAFIPVAILVIFFFCCIQRFYIATSRQLKRLESVSRSPIYSHFLETLVGSSSIRAYGLSEKFIEQSAEKVDLNHQSYYLNIVSNRWLSIRSETVCNLMAFLAALLAVLNRRSISSSVAALSIEVTLQIAFSINWILLITLETETNIVSIERMKEFIDVPQEPAWEIPEEKLPPMWPSKGEICFQDFKVRYRKGLELVLKGISFIVNGGEKVGIVGRTGAGKSSLTLSLFRILESAGGKILIDGVDIAALGSHTVRSKLTIIPQDPVVFSGSLRMNLDPFEEHSDDNIWYALELAHLKPYISSLDGGLLHEVTEAGENFSVGQRQLICLARALLRKTKILILDEATAAVDLETDDLIQSTIRKEFKDCTVLTIAHRLNTVMDYDKILVFDEGYVVEYDSPQTLLESKNSLFYRMAADSGLFL